MGKLHALILFQKVMIYTLLQKKFEEEKLLPGNIKTFGTLPDRLPSFKQTNHAVAFKC